MLPDFRVQPPDLRVQDSPQKHVEIVQLRTGLPGTQYRTSGCALPDFRVHFAGLPGTFLACYICIKSIQDIHK
jgi:hypothetical protein